jgi:hypothetical protein
MGARLSCILEVNGIVMSIMLLDHRLSRAYESRNFPGGNAFLLFPRRASVT